MIKLHYKEILAWLKNKKLFLKYPLILLSILSLILSLLAIFFAYFSKDVINAAIESNRSRFIIYAVLIVAILICNLILTATNNYLTTYYKGRVSKQLKTYYYNLLMRTKQYHLNERHSGTLLTYLDSDVDIVSLEIVDIVPSLIFYLARFLGAFILLFVLDPMFALIFLGLGLALVIGSRLIAKPMKKRHLELQTTLSESRSFMQESIENIEIIKSFQAEEKMNEKNKIKQEKLFKSRLKKDRLNIFTSSGLSLFFSFGYASAIIFGAYRLQSGLTVGGLLAMIQLVQHIQSPFNGISRLIPKYAQLLASAERLMTMDHYEVELAHPIVNKDFEQLNISHLIFSYDKDIILSDFSLDIKKQEVVHILGPSGKGKSTIFKLLLGLLDVQKGTIKIKTSENVYPISNQTRSFFSYVPQNFLMLSGTIRENLNLFQTYSDDILYDKLKIAELDLFVKALPEGLNTRLKEKGGGLSIGQIQRLAIARALLKDAPILLFDEVTSALDQENETKILANIKRLTNKTVIMSSHKISTSQFITKTIEL